MLLLLSSYTVSADSDLTDVPVTVEMYDVASVPEPVLSDVVSEVEKVYKEAELPLAIAPQQPDPEVARDLANPVRSARDAQPPECAPAFDVRVQITNRISPLYKPGAAAFSLPFSHGGIRVTVFYDRVKNISRNTGVPLPRVLAVVLAHEIGHVLMGNDAHAEEGIMRPYWDRKDFGEVAGDLPSLSDEDLWKMRRRLTLWRKVTPPCSADPQRPVS